MFPALQAHQAPEIFRLIIAQGLRLLGAGLAIGMAGSLILSRILRGMLYGVGPNDPLVFVGVLAVLGVVAIIACVLPARRATRVHPAGVGLLSHRGGRKGLVIIAGLSVAATGVGRNHVLP